MSSPTAMPQPDVGTVYGTILNDRATVARMSKAFEEVPYKAPPKSPVLYIKPRNTHAGNGAAVAIPAAPGRVRIDATVGAVIGRRATAIRAADAMQYVSGWRIVSDVTLPHDNVYRPAIQQRCRDGFCPMSEVFAPGAFEPSSAEIVTAINGTEVHRFSLANLVRPIEQLLAEVTDFMTLEPGDVLLVGVPEGAPTAGPGDTVEIEVASLGTLEHSVVREGEAS